MGSEGTLASSHGELSAKSVMPSMLLCHYELRADKGGIFCDTLQTLVGELVEGLFEMLGPNHLILKWITEERSNAILEVQPLDGFARRTCVAAGLGSCEAVDLVSSSAGRDAKGDDASGSSFPPPDAVMGTVADFGLRSLAQDQLGPTGLLEIARPAQACTDLSSMDIFQDAWVLIDRGGCAFVEKARRAQAAGALGVVVADTGGGGIVMNSLGDGDKAEDLHIPAVLVSKADGDLLRKRSTQGKVRVHLSKIAKQALRYLRIIVPESSKNEVKALHEKGLVDLSRIYDKDNRQLPAIRIKLKADWILGAFGASCDSVCSVHGGCVEGTWPSSLEEFTSVASAAEFSCLGVQPGGALYDPSTDGRYCGWDGGNPSVHRCGVAVDSGTRRFCPCRVKAGTEMKSPVGAQTTVGPGIAVATAAGAAAAAVATSLLP